MAKLCWANIRLMTMQLSGGGRLSMLAQQQYYDFQQAAVSQLMLAQHQADNYFSGRTDVESTN